MTLLLCNVSSLPQVGPTRLLGFTAPSRISSVVAEKHMLFTISTLQMSNVRAVAGVLGFCSRDCALQISVQTHCNCCVRCAFGFVCRDSSKGSFANLSFHCSRKSCAKDWTNCYPYCLGSRPSVAECVLRSPVAVVLAHESNLAALWSEITY